MQPSYDSWDADPSAVNFEDPFAPDPFAPDGSGLVDIGKGKGPPMGGGKGGSGSWDSWDSWDNNSNNISNNNWDQPSNSWDQPNNTWDQPCNSWDGGGGKGPPCQASKGDFVPRPSHMAAKGGYAPPGPPGPPSTGPDSFGGKACGGYGKGGYEEPSLAGKGAQQAIRGKAPLRPMGDPYPTADGNLGNSYKGSFSCKGKLAPRKAVDSPGAVGVPTSKAPGYTAPPPLPAAPMTAPGPSAAVTVPPPARSMLPPGPGKGQDIPRGPMAPPMVGVRSVGPPPELSSRGPARPPPVGPRVHTIPLGAKGVPRVTLQGHDTRSAAAGLGSALAAVAVAARSGPGVTFTGRPGHPLRAMPGISPRPMHLGVTPPPPTSPVPAHLLPGLARVASQPHLPPLASGPRAPASTSGLAPELAALVSAGEGDPDAGGNKVKAPTEEKKPRIYLLITRLAPDLEEGHLQQILEQCGELQAFRRGRDANGALLSFGFAQFGDPEAAWKASTCLSKRVLCGQEIKVMVEEHAEALITQWRKAQQAVLRVGTDEELDWELERKAVSCKALIDAKIEEIYGPPKDGSVGGAIAQRRQELREREKKRIERTRKRKAWREEEYTKELSLIESAEKRLRREEIARDDADRAKEQRDQEDQDEDDNANLKLSILDESGARPGRPVSRKLCEMVDIVQAEPRDELFRREFNVAHLRNEKLLESKLRPWLERKIDFCMGGPQSDLVEHILRRVNANSLPDQLISELSRYLDDNAEPIVERMWRMLFFELMRAGLAFTEELQKGKKEEMA